MIKNKSTIEVDSNQITTLEDFILKYTIDINFRDMDSLYGLKIGQEIELLNMTIKRIN